MMMTRKSRSRTSLLSGAAAAKDEPAVVELYFHSVESAMKSWRTTVQAIPDYELLIGTILFNE
jgi:hypothetical protein